MNTESSESEIFILHSHRGGSIWPDQSTASAIQSILRSGYWRLSAEQMPFDSYKDRSSGAVVWESFERTTRYALTDWQSSLSWPMQAQCGSGSPAAIRVVFWANDAAEISRIDPYSSACATTFAVVPGYESGRFPLRDASIRWGSPKVLVEAEADIQVIKEMASPIVAENWDEKDDLRFDFLVEKEALGELSLEDEKDLERLSNKRDRTVARVSDEDLLRERMRNRVLTQLQDWLETNAPLFARRAK